MNKRVIAGLLAGVTASAALLTGCSGSGDSTEQTSSAVSSAEQSTEVSHSTSAPAKSSTAAASTTASEAASHQHSTDGGAAPAGMVAAKSPQFTVGEKVQLTADHMDGMKGSTGEVVGAYDTVVYEVDYTPTDGSAPVKNHKWVVQEELDAPAGHELKAGDTVTLKADHMPGMEGAKATVVSAKKETVYMVNYTSGGKHYTNHKWVTGDEMKAEK